MPTFGGCWERAGPRQPPRGGGPPPRPPAVTILPANPGIYAQTGTYPLQGLVYHASSHATGLVSVDGSVQPGDVATINIRDRAYNYTVQAGDTLDSIRDNLIVLLNLDPEVTAK